MKKILALTLTLLVLVGFFAAQAMAWGVKTHNYAARLLMEELNELKRGDKYYLLLPPYEGVFEVPKVFGDALTEYPQAFYAGSLGPDLYPDLFAGRHWVHDADSMPWVTTMIARVNSMPDGEQKDEAMAFTLGFMSHYCADLFGSDYINSMARGQMISSLLLTDHLQIDPNATNDMMAYARHLAVSAGLDERIDDTYNHTDVKAPVDFVMQNLIYDGAPNNGISKHYGISSNSAPAEFAYLVNFRSAIHTVAENVKTVAVIGAAASIFTENWINKFDEAVVKYVEASNVVAQRILLSHASELSETRIFVEEISDWVEKYGLSISPFPDIGGGDGEKGLIEKAKMYVINLVAQVFGYEDFKALVIDVVFKLLDGFDKLITTALKGQFPEISSLYELVKEPAKPLFTEEDILRDFARDASVLEADSAAGTEAADQSMEAIYNSLTMMKLMLIGPESYQALLNHEVSGVSSAYQMSQGNVNANRVRITIHTADVTYAGTDDNVYLNITGKKADGSTYTKRTLLDKPKYDDFERNDTDSYDVDLGADMSIGSLEFTIEKDFVLISDDWMIDWVEIVPYMGSAAFEKATGGQVTYNTWLDREHKTLTLHDFFANTGMTYNSPLHAGILPQSLELDRSEQWKLLQFWGGEMPDSELREDLFFALFKGYSPDAAFSLTSGGEEVDQTINKGDMLTIDANLINCWNGIPATRRAQSWLSSKGEESESYEVVTGELMYEIISSGGSRTQHAVDILGQIVPGTYDEKQPIQNADTLAYKVTANVGDTLTIIASYAGDDWNAPATYEVARLLVVSDNQYAFNVENGAIDTDEEDPYNGKTMGLYTRGAEISVTADVPQENTYFVGWVSEDIELTDEQKAHTTLELIMPEKDVTVTACYEVVPPHSEYMEYYSLSVVNGKGSGVFEEGDTVTVIADAPGSDEVFAGWESNDVELSDEQKLQTTFTFTMPGNDVVIAADYRIKENEPADTTAYRVSVINGTGDGVYEVGKQVTVKADVLPDKRFIRWESKDVSLTDEKCTAAYLTFTMPANDVILIACYEDVEKDEPEVVSYALSVVGGTGDGLYEAGETVTAVAMPEEGRLFDGWTTEGMTLSDEQKMDTSLTFDMPANDVTLTAHYTEAPVPEKASYVLRVINGTGDGLYEAGEQVTITAIEPKAGMRFAGWSSADVDLENVKEISYTFVMPARDVTVGAEYEKEMRFVLSVINGMGDGVYEAGAQVLVTANEAPSGWRFERWSGDGIELTKAQQGSRTFELTMPDNDVTLNALYAQIEIPEDDPSDGPEGDPSDGPEGDPSDDPKADPSDGPEADPSDNPKADPKGDPSDGPEDDPLDIPEEDPLDQTYYAVTVINGTGDGVYESGETVTVSLVETEDEEFIGWQFINAEDEELISDRMQKTFTFIMPARNVRIIGAFQFCEVSHQLVVVNGTGDGTHREGEKVLVAAYSEEEMNGAKFVRWESEEAALTSAQKTSPSFEMTMPGWDVVLTAVFEEDIPTEQTYHVEAIGGWGSGEYEAGELVVIFADTPETGMHFAGWTSDQMDLIKLYPEMTADLDLLAFYMPECDITITANYEHLPPVPPTGDDSSLPLWSALAAGSLCGAALLMRSRRRKVHG